MRNLALAAAATGVALLVPSSSSSSSAPRAPTPVLSFEDVRATVPHVLHEPELVAVSELGPHVADADLEVKLTVPVMGSGGTSDRTATIHAQVATDLVAPNYEEIYHFSNGTQHRHSLPASQRRCYWRGSVTFSDGATGQMAFTSCGRGSTPHAAYLADLASRGELETVTTTTTTTTTTAAGAGKGEDDRQHVFAVDPRTTDTPFHFVRGVIHEHGTGRRYAVEPRDFVRYRASGSGSGGSSDGSGSAPSSPAGQEQHPLEGPLRLGQHYAYRASDFQEGTGFTGRCGSGTTNDDHHHHVHPRVGDSGHHSHDHHEHDHEHDHDHGDREQIHDHLRHREVKSTGMAHGRRLQLGTRYVELLVSNDFLRTTSHGIDFVGDDSLTIANQVGLFYGQEGVDAGMDYDIRLAVVGQNAFVDEDPWTGRGTVSYTLDEVDVSDLLSEYARWQDGESSNFNFVNTASMAFDNAHLFSHEDFLNSNVGLAYVGGMCHPTSFSSGVNQVNTGFVLSTTTVAHEMGHNFGMTHDGDGNACPDTGFIMAPAASNNDEVTFSSCSATLFNTFAARESPYSSQDGAYALTCLSSSPPGNVWADGVCGDGMLSGDEECDTGGVVDSCCNYLTCQLFVGAQCAPTNHPCCTDACTFTPFEVDGDSNVECRASTGFCDPAEFCHGDSGECPTDTSCTSTKYTGGGVAGKCFNGDCVSLDDRCYEFGFTVNGETTWREAYGSCNDNDDCGSLHCTRGTSGCLTGSDQAGPVLVPDGGECGGSNVCAAGSCVSADSLYTAACGDGFVDTGAGEACDCASGDCSGIEASCDARTCTYYVAGPRDCVGDWSAWGLCSATCEGGTKSRSYVVTTTAANGGAACDETDGAVSTTECNTVDCSIATTTTPATTTGATTTTATPPTLPFADECPVSSGAASMDCYAAGTGQICCVAPGSTTCELPDDCTAVGGEYNPQLSNGESAVEERPTMFGLDAVVFWVLIGVGGFIVLLLIIIIACVCCCKKKSRNYEVKHQKPQQQHRQPTGLNPHTAPPPFQQQAQPQYAARYNNGRV